MGALISIGAFILVLSFLVVIHEFGHFFAAKWAKIKVEEFGVGYPPRALKLFTWWGTIFSLNWIPFGGFVRMEGEDEEPTTLKDPAFMSSKEKSTKAGAASRHKASQEGPFFTKSAFHRLVVILAGAAVNFVFGVIAFAIVFTVVGIPSGGIIDEIAGQSPAEKAGLKAQTAIVGFVEGGRTIPVESINEVIRYVEAHRGQTITVRTIGPCAEFRCENNAQEFNVYVRTVAETPEGQGSLGVRFYSEFARFYPWYEMPFRGAWYGLKQAIGLSKLIVVALRGVATDIFQKAEVPAEVSGPVGIVRQAHQIGIFSQGWLAVLSFAGMLSVNLAIMNILPIPALDGGRAVMILLELIIGRSRVARVEGYVNYVGYIFLLGLILFTTARDILQLFV